MTVSDSGVIKMLKRLLDGLKASLVDQHPELDESHAKTRYAQMAREVCEKEASHDTD